MSQVDNKKEGKPVAFNRNERMCSENSFTSEKQQKKKSKDKTRVKYLLKNKRTNKDKDKDSRKDSPITNFLTPSPTSPSRLVGSPQRELELAGFVALEDPEDDLSLVTLQDLVKGLTTRSMEVHSGLTLRKSFFLTFGQFSTPYQLLKMIKDEFFAPPDPAVETLQSWTKKRAGIQEEVLEYWLEEQISDFAEDETKELLFSFFTEMEKDEDKERAKYGETLRNVYTTAIEKNKEKEKKEQEKEQQFDLPPMDLSYDTFDEEEVALSLTLQEFRLFQKITLRELLDWNKKDRESFCPNISRLISISNRVSGWVTSMLVKQTRLLERVKLFEKFICLTQVLLEMRNFSSCVAVVGGLSSSSFWRMKKTWKCANPEIVDSFQKIRNLVSHHTNYSRYRAFLNLSSTPCVPFIGVVLTDLTFIADGNKDTQLGCINFQKFRLLAKVLVEFQSLLTGHYTCLEEANIPTSFVNGLLEYPLLSEDEKHQFSQYSEPKNAEEAISTLMELYLETKTQLAKSMESQSAPSSPC